MRSLLQDTKEGRTIMEILGKVLSEKTEAIYKDITGGLIYPIKIVKLDPENEEDCSRPVAGHHISMLHSGLLHMYKHRQIPVGLRADLNQTYSLP